MRAFALDQPGETGSVRDLPDPVPGDGQVRVRVEAAGLNPADLGMMSGGYRAFMEYRLPLIPGSDVSGVVDAVGKDATTLKVGDAVLGVVNKPYVGEGSLAELVTASEGTLTRRPAAIDAIFGGAVPLAGVSAAQLVEAADLRAGDVVVILGAAGGIGGFATELAAGRGFTVVAVTRAVNHSYVKDLGAAQTIDYATENVVDVIRQSRGARVGAVLDLVGDKAVTNQLAELLVKGGKVISMRGGADVDALKERGITGVNTRTQVNSETLAQLVELVTARKLRRPEIQTFPLAKSTDAFAILASRHLRGKLVIQV